MPCKNQNGSKLKFIFVHSTKGKKLVQFQFFISSYRYQTVSAAVELAYIGSCLSLCLISLSYAVFVYDFTEQRLFMVSSLNIGRATTNSDEPLAFNRTLFNHLSQTTFLDLTLLISKFNNEKNSSITFAECAMLASPIFFLVSAIIAEALNAMDLKQTQLICKHSFPWIPES